MTGWYAAQKQDLINLYNAREAPRASYGQLYEDLEKFCASRKLTMPKILIGDGNAMMANNTPFACAMKDTIFLSHHAPAQFGKNLNAIVGHELSHANRHYSEIAIRKASPFALPAILVAAMYMHDVASQRKHDSSVKETIARLEQLDPQKLHDQIVQDALAQGLIDPKDVVMSGGKYALAVDIMGHGKQLALDSLHVKKYAVAAGAGILAGHALESAASRHFEYRADQLGAEFGGKEQMQNALRTTERILGQGKSPIPEETHLFGRMRNFAHQIFSAEHPSMVNRVGAIR